MASEARSAGSRAGEANTTALSPLSDGNASGGRGSRRGGNRDGAGRGVGRGNGDGGGGAGEGRVEVAELDVGEGDGRAGGDGLDSGGDTGGRGASTASNTGAGGIGADGVVAVEPLHVGGVVVPDGEREDHSAAHGVTHTSETTVLSEVVGVAEGGLLLSAEVVGDLVGLGDSGDVGLRVGDDLTVLNVEAADGAERAGVGAVVGNELGDDGEDTGGVDGQALAEEGLVAHAEGVEVAAVGVAETGVPGAVRTRAAGLAGGLAGVGREGRGVVVGLPDIHLTAAGTERTSTSVGRGGVPADKVGLSIT